jgi:ketosteroid isomerase-like protein
VRPDDLVRAAVEAWNGDDVEAWTELLQPDVIYRTSGAFPGLRAAYTGHEGMYEFWHAMHEPWEVLRVDLDRLREVDEHNFVVEFRFRATGAESGASVDLCFTNAFRIRDGLVAEILAARTYEDALDRIRESPTKSELVRRAYEVAWAQRSIEGFEDRFTDDFTWRQRAEWPGRPVYTRDELYELWAELDETYSEFNVVPVEYVEAGEYVVVTIKASACVRASDDRVEVTQWHVWRFEDGRAAEASVYRTRHDALDVAGIRE